MKEKEKKIMKSNCFLEELPDLMIGSRKIKKRII